MLIILWKDSLMKTDHSSQSKIYKYFFFKLLLFLNPLFPISKSQHVLYQWFSKRIYLDQLPRLTELNIKTFFSPHFSSNNNLEKCYFIAKLILLRWNMDSFLMPDKQLSTLRLHWPFHGQEIFHSREFQKQSLRRAL